MISVYLVTNYFRWKVAKPLPKVFNKSQNTHKQVNELTLTQ